MNVGEVVQYWLGLAEGDWPVAEHLFISGDYHYALFFGHLYLEKLLKALVSRQRGSTLRGRTIYSSWPSVLA